MATEVKVMSRTATLVTDGSDLRWHILRHTAEDNVNIASLATVEAGEMAGVLQNAPASGDRATVGYFGESKVVAGAAITANKAFTTNGSGRAVTCTSGDTAVGIALQAANADGETFRALIFPPMPFEPRL